jgi:SPP1 family phage portal protein
VEPFDRRNTISGVEGTTDYKISAVQGEEAGILIDSKELQKIIASDRARQSKIARQAAYVRGENPAILAPYPQEEPDNRIPIPFARRAVNMILGYVFKEGNIVYSGDGYDDDLKDTFDMNDEGLIDLELAATALAHGNAYELHWTEEGSDQFAQIPVSQCIPVYNDSLRPKMIAFVRYWTKDNINYAHVYDESTMQAFKWARGAEPTVDGDPVEHAYGAVPIIKFPISPDGSNIFDHVTALIDFLDKVLSENYANELSKLSEAILALAGRVDDTPDEDGVSDVDRVRASGIMQNLGDGTRAVTDLVAYITKNINPAFLESGFDRAYDLFYESAQLPNPKETNNGEASGVAHKFRILAFEYLCTTIATYFAIGLQNRIKMIKGISANLSASGEQNTDVTITFNRNLPDDIFQLSQIAANLKGTLSDETILRMFPTYVVEDVEAELEKVNRQRDESVDLFNRQSADDDNDNDAEEIDA